MAVCGPRNVEEKVKRSCHREIRPNGLGENVYSLLHYRMEGTRK